MNDTSRASTVVQPDSLVLQVPARLSSTSVGLRGFVKGTAPVIFTAAGYSPDTVVVAVDTGQLSLVSPPNGLGPGQVATQMYVQLSYTTAAALLVNLASDNPAVLTVPSTVTIPANNYYAYFNVTGTGLGTANVTATATGVKSAAPVPVHISTPKLAVNLSTLANAGQRVVFQVYAYDSLGNLPNEATVLTVTLTSSTPAHTHFDATTVTIPVGSYYVSTGVLFDTAGSYTVTASAPGYTPGIVATTTNGLLVRIQDNLFSPATITIPVGTLVTWGNYGLANHTTTSTTGLWNSGTLTPGSTYGYTFATAGTYQYYCTIHGAAVMSGTVVVR